VIVAIAATIGIILYRISVLAVLYIMDDEFVYKNATILVSITAALINLVIIFVLNYVRIIIFALFHISHVADNCSHFHMWLTTRSHIKHFEQYCLIYSVCTQESFVYIISLNQPKVYSGRSRFV